MEKVKTIVLRQALNYYGKIGNYEYIGWDRKGGDVCGSDMFDAIEAAPALEMLEKMELFIEEVEPSILPENHRLNRRKILREIKQFKERLK